jgi:hypothetical protein
MRDKMEEISHHIADGEESVRCDEEEFRKPHF